VRPWAKWLASGLVVSTVCVSVAALFGPLLGWNWSPWLAAAPGVLAIVLAGLSLRGGAIADAADGAFVASASLAGLFAIAAGAYAVVLLLAGRAPVEGERWFLGLALLVVAIAALVYRALYPRFERAARRLVAGDHLGDRDLARTLASRMTRAVPLEELALQVAESLRAELHLKAVELWTVHEGALRPWIGDPDFHRASLPLSGLDPATVVQAGLSGHGWMKVWLPAMLEDREESYVRMAPMSHAGELQGVIVAERPVSAGESFSADEERTVVELGRMLGVALRNAQLDSALQASLDEVRRQAEELQASRGRIVAAADQARREIERNLHDGAQQHVVALGIQVKLARTMLDTDLERATKALDALSSAVDDTLHELRDLAHGIYPPLLADKGLHDALASAARRAVRPTTVRAENLARYPAEAEATVYFCVLEALQNAGKYAGEAASITVDVREEGSGLIFVVADDGLGFDVRGKGVGAGFQNMQDRLGSLGGTLRVEAKPSRGTRVTGVLPVTALPLDERVDNG
jgi:signal transduction histidine kinase